MNNKKSIVNKVVDGFTGIFLPIVNLLSAAGILKGILAVLSAAQILSESGETFLVLNAIADSLFYFFPMILAFTAAQKFKTNQFTAVVIAGVLLYPALSVIFESGTGVSFAGLPIKAVVYRSSVIPIILAVGLLKYVERFVSGVLPEMIKGFLTPLISIVTVSLITLLVFGPVGAVVGEALAACYEFIYGISPIIAGAVLGAVIQPMVIFGFHWSFLLIGMNNIALRGADTVLALIGPAVFAQAGAALAVFFKCEDRNLKSVCLSSALSAALGVTEPAMFGVNLPLKKPMLAVCIGGAAGGAVAGYSGVQATAFALPSLASLPVFLGEGFGLFLISCLFGLIAAFAATMIMKFEFKPDKAM